MLDQNKATLEKANAAVKAGDNEGFLSYCVEDLVWTTVGQGSLRGKPAVREWMRDNYVKPPRFTVDEMIAQGDLVAALGTIEIDVDGAPAEAPQDRGLGPEQVPVEAEAGELATEVSEDATDG